MKKEKFFEEIRNAKTVEELEEIQKKIQALLEEEKADEEEVDNEEERKENEEETTETDKKEEVDNEEERNLINANLEENQVEIRKAVENKLKEVEKREETKVESIDSIIRKPEYRTAWAKSMLGKNNFTPEERTALQAVTTTATEFVAQQSGTAGVNNGGLFIPKSVSLEILKQIELASPFLSDVAKTHVKGLLKYPYRVSATPAEFVGENKEGNFQNAEFKELTFGQHELTAKIRVTWKLEAMAVEEFIKYIIEELAVTMREELAKAVLYGEGGADKLKGATVDAFKVTDEADPVIAMKKALEKLDVRDQATAVIYIAKNVENAVIFAKDKNGAYLNSPVNGMALKSLASNTIKVDPFLKNNEILVGNARDYKLNYNEEISLSFDKDVHVRATDYIGYAVVGGAPVPKKFAHATVTPSL